MSTDPKSENQTVFKEKSTEDETETEPVEDSRTQSGLEKNIAGALCYLAWAITGIIFLVIEKENRFVRFHAMQSIITSVSIFVVTILLSLIPFIGWIVSVLLTPVILVLWLFMMWKAYQGEMFKLPYIGDYAEKLLDKNVTN